MFLDQRGCQGLIQELNRESLSAARGHEVIRSLHVNCEHGLCVDAVTWAEYWAGLPEMACGPWCRALDALSRAREAYFDSGFQLAEAARYCCQYFSLLRDLLEHGPNDPQVLARLLQLEVFSIESDLVIGGAAAGVLAPRHPVYLLARLCQPRAYDDPKFLPLVSAPADDGQHDRSSALFFHYRQIRIAQAPAVSLLMYLAVDSRRRSGTFAAVEAMASALSPKSDPRSRQRATRIADWAIGPFLTRCASVSAREANRPGEIGFVDLGGGSGSLLAGLCKRLIHHWPDLVDGRKFAWSMVDLGLRDASRRTHSPSLRRHMAYINYEAADLRTWATDNRADQGRADVLLLCRVLNNMSLFSIESSTDLADHRKLAGPKRKGHPFSQVHPAQCLAGPTPNPAALIATNGRVRLRGGQSFRQVSLSDYFRGLARLDPLSLSPLDKRDRVFFPLRRFDPACLLTDKQTSLIEHCCRRADLVVIEDVDLSPDHLVEHLTAHRLHHLAVSDATDRIRMQSASLFCITRRELAAALPGKRIW